MKTHPKILASEILFGATQVSPADDAQKTKRIVMAQLYRRYRFAREATAMASRRQAQLNGHSEHVRRCIATENEAWNSLQVMRAVLFRTAT